LWGQSVTFIGADVDVETGVQRAANTPTGGSALLGSQYARAEAFKWRGVAPELQVSLVHRFNSSQVGGAGEFDRRIPAKSEDVSTLRGVLHFSYCGPRQTWTPREEKAGMATFPDAVLRVHVLSGVRV